MGLLAPSRYDEDHEAFRDSVRRFVAAEVTPYLDAWRTAGGAPAELYAALGEQGFLGVAVPEDCGGGGVDDPRFTAVLVEEIASSGALGVAAVVAAHCGVGIPAVSSLPASDERTAWLTAAAAGTGIVVPAAVREGRAGSVAGGATARLFVVVDGGGVTLLPAERVRAEPVTVLGCRDADAADVVVAAPDAGLPLENRERVLHDASLWGAVTMLAGARAAYGLTTDYVGDRKVFGRPIASFENTVHRLAELAAELVAAQALVESCFDSTGDDTIATAAAAALVAQQVHARVVDQGIQLHGGYGYMREYPIAHAFADARALQLAFAALTDPRPQVATAAGL